MYSKVKIRALWMAAAFALGGCSDVPEFAPPPQRPSFEGYAPHSPAPVVDMSDSSAPLYFVRDISRDASAGWRWTGQHPEVKVTIWSGVPLKYTIDFTLPEATFKDTGPVTVTFLVNDRVLDRVHYTHAGNFHFEKPVPRDWLSVGQDATAGAEIDKMWVSKNGRERYGFILSRIGLTE